MSFQDSLPAFMASRAVKGFQSQSRCTMEVFAFGSSWNVSRCIWKPSIPSKNWACPFMRLALDWQPLRRQHSCIQSPLLSWITTGWSCCTPLLAMELSATLETSVVARSECRLSSPLATSVVARGRCRGGEYALAGPAPGTFTTIEDDCHSRASLVSATYVHFHCLHVPPVPLPLLIVCLSLCGLIRDAVMPYSCVSRRRWGTLPQPQVLLMVRFVAESVTTQWWLIYGLSELSCLQQH
jgi:hypothetical protein